MKKIKIVKTRIKSTTLPSHADLYKDLHMFDPAVMAWTDLTRNFSGTAPSPRAYHGFTAAGGWLYVHGGWGENGDVCRGAGFLDYQKIWLSCVGDSSHETVACKAYSHGGGARQRRCYASPGSGGTPYLAGVL